MEDITGTMFWLLMWASFMVILAIGLLAFAYLIFDSFDHINDVELDDDPVEEEEILQ